LVLKTLEVADEANKQALNKLMNTPTTDETAKITAVKIIYNQFNIRELAEEKKSAYLDTAFQHMTAIQVSDERKQPLIKLANELMMREV